MKTLDIIKLNEAGTKKVIDSLQNLLADFQVYYTNLRSFHWNVKGKGFFRLHDQYEEMYTEVADQIDEIAERILMLGGTPENKFSNYLKTAQIKEVSAVNDADQTVKSTLESLSHLIASERKIVALADENDDEVTLGQMGDYLSAQEKQVWMLTAFLG